MIRTAMTGAVLATLLAASVPLVAGAQDAPTTPEGVEWHLEGYAVDGEIGIVPWHVDATLLLQDGQASGSTGCNQFSGSYSLEGEALTFDPAMTMTRMACPEDQTAVEGGYMAALPQTATWAIEDGFLSLADAEGNHILGFEQSVIALTASDVAAIATLFTDQQAQIERLDERLGNVKIGTLRDRIKSLEAEVTTLRSQGSQGASGSAFSAAEKVLLEAIPANIKKTCSPRRSANPAGTVAAVQCKPNAAVVADMAYYLMEAGKAGNAWDAKMNQYNVKDGPGSCRNGKKDKEYSTPGPDADGCYRNENGIANLRYIARATSCRQLNAGGTQLKHPALYMAVLGSGADLAALTKWAEPQKYGGPDNLYQQIKRPNEAWDTSCPT